jgi:hypothetical protein
VSTLRIAVSHPDADHPLAEVFQHGATFDLPVDIDAHLAAAEADYPAADGFEHEVQELVPSDDGETASWEPVS